MFEKIDRIAIAVKDLRKSAAFFSDLLGVDFEDVGENADLGMHAAYSPSGLELIESTKPGSMIERFIQTRGEGLWGVVIKVKDIEAAVEHFKSRGMRVAGDFEFGEMREVAFHPKDAHGVEIILCAYPDRHPATVASSDLLSGVLTKIATEGTDS